MLPNTETQTMKTSTRYWIQEIGSTALILIVFPIFAIAVWGSRVYFLGGFALLVGILSLARDLKPAFRSEILVTRSEIRGQVGRLEFAELWEEIKAVSFSGSGTASELMISTEKNIVPIPSKYFDQKELEKHLRAHLSPQVFDPLAYKELPQYQAWEHERKTQFDNLNEPLRVSVGRSEKNNRGHQYWGWFAPGKRIVF